MTEPFAELKMYKNFDELANDVLDFATELLPEQMLYLSAIENEHQMMYKIANQKNDIPMFDGMVIELNKSLCSLIDFEKKQPLVIDSVLNADHLGELKEGLEQAHVRSYLGLPIILTNGKIFGTLCAINNEISLYEEKNINLLQRIVRLFIYYLELEQFAWKDALTGLHNRRYLSKYFNDHPQQAGALFFLDLDGFKQVNDVFGHEIGDIVLQEVANRLRIITQEIPDAFAVRLGGDEFVLQISHKASRAEWEHLALKILERLGTWQSAYRVSTSIGILEYDETNDHSLQMLLKQADVALYAAKASGKNTYQFYSTNMN